MQRDVSIREAAVNYPIDGNLQWENMGIIPGLSESDFMARQRYLGDHRCVCMCVCGVCVCMCVCVCLCVCLCMCVLQGERQKVKRSANCSTTESTDPLCQETWLLYCALHSL